MDAESRIYVAGAGTFVGRTLLRRLSERGFSRVVADAEPDLGDRAAVEQFFTRTRPDYVFVTAGASAGIAGNQRRPADLMLDNLLAGTHVISAAWNAGTERLLYLATSCVYPKQAPQPFSPSSLWTGPVEPSSDAYAVAKLAGIRLCEAYRRQHGAKFSTVIGADPYGPGDDFDPDNSHVAAALLRRIYDATAAGLPNVEIWGSGTPQREFIYVDDLADACIFAMDRHDGAGPLNLGTGVATSIAELARTISEVTGYKGTLTFDPSKPDGMPFKGLDSTPLRNMGWEPEYDLRTGLQKTAEWLTSYVR